MKKQRIAVIVSPENIFDAKPYCRERCPIALALNDLGFSNPLVTTRSASFYRDSSDSVRTNATLPERASRFVNRFDKHGPQAVRPFRFYLTLDPWLN